MGLETYDVHCVPCCNHKHWTPGDIMIFVGYAIGMAVVLKKTINTLDRIRWLWIMQKKYFLKI
jgi:hypothetical protein